MLRRFAVALVLALSSVAVSCSGGTPTDVASAPAPSSPAESAIPSGPSPIPSPSPSPSPSPTGQPASMASLCDHIQRQTDVLIDFTTGAVTVSEMADEMDSFQDELEADALALRAEGLYELAVPARTQATHAGQVKVALRSGDVALATQKIKAMTNDVDDMIAAGLYCPHLVT